MRIFNEVQIKTLVLDIVSSRIDRKMPRFEA